MNHEKHNPNSWDYFWTEVVEKQYQKGVDYEIYETGFCKKNYHILSEKLKKVYREFYEKKFGEKHHGNYQGYNWEGKIDFFSNNNRNSSYSPFPWLEETLKNYQENADYKIEYLNGYKHYTLLSDRLKKFVEEEWHQKKTKPPKWQDWQGSDSNKPSIENFVKWRKEELPKYQEGVDYRVERTPLSGGGIDEKYLILSEKMKKGIDNWNVTQAEDDFFGENFSNWFFHQGSADYHRQQEWEKKRVEEKRQKFIADNDPPLLKWAFLNEKDKLFNSQQSPLTAAEKAALNDPSLTYCGDWEGVLWYIQANRRANSELYSDEHFAWDRGRELKGITLEALQKAGAPLDKLFQRVEKGRQIRLRQIQEKAQQDKATILAHLDDWVCRGSDSISNWKTTQTLTLTKDGNITKHRFFVEYWGGGRENGEGGKIDEKEIIDGCFDTATFQELRAAIFQNILKNLWENKNYPAELRKKNGWEILEKENFSSAEWTEIQKAMGKEVSTSENSKKNSPDNSSSQDKKLMIISIVVILVILAVVGGIILIKKRKKKNGSKR